MPDSGTPHRRERRGHIEVISRRRQKTEHGRGKKLKPASWRPRTRGDCINVRRPCLHFAFRYNLALDVSDKSGSIFLRDVTESCALDVADRGPHELEAIGDMLGVSRERIRQIEERAIRKLRNGIRSRLLRALWGELES